MFDFFLGNLNSTNRGNAFSNVVEAENFLDSITLGSKHKVVSRDNIDTFKWVTNSEVVKHVKEYSYKLINIPDISAERSAYELHSTTAGPVKPPFGYEVGAGRFTIGWMIESFSKKIPFEFERWQDCCEVANYLNLYLKQLEFDFESYTTRLTTKDLKSMCEQIEIFLHMTRELRDYLVPLAKRLSLYHNRTSEDKTKQYLDNYKKLVPPTKKPRFHNPLDDIVYLKDSANRLKR